MNTRCIYRLPLMISVTFVMLITSAKIQGQSCKDSYNSALGNYNKGLYENINSYLNGCIDQIKNSANHNYYKGTEEGRSILFKVYRICINSYRNLEQGNLAEQKLAELVSYLNWSRADVENRLNNTPLTAI